MKRLDKELIVKLSKDLKLELTQDQVSDFEEGLKTYSDYVTILQGIDTEGVNVMSYPFETPTTWLRDDKVTHELTHELAFKNAPRVEGDFFETVKVVHKGE